MAFRALCAAPLPSPAHDLRPPRILIIHLQLAQVHASPFCLSLAHVQTCLAASPFPISSSHWDPRLTAFPTPYQLPFLLASNLCLELATGGHLPVCPICFPPSPRGTQYLHSPHISAGIWCPLRAPSPSPMFEFGAARASFCSSQAARLYQGSRLSHLFAFRVALLRVHYLQTTSHVPLRMVMNDFGDHAFRFRASHSSGVPRRYG